MLRRGVASATEPFEFGLGVSGPAGALARVATSASRPVTTGYGYRWPQSKQVDDRWCLGPGEFSSHTRGYAVAYNRASFRCNSSQRLDER